MIKTTRLFCADLLGTLESVVVAGHIGHDRSFVRLGGVDQIYIGLSDIIIHPEFTTSLNTICIFCNLLDTRVYSSTPSKSMIRLQITFNSREISQKKFDAVIFSRASFSLLRISNEK